MTNILIALSPAPFCWFVCYYFFKHRNKPWSIGDFLFSFTMSVFPGFNFIYAFVGIGIILEEEKVKPFDWLFKDRF